MTEHRDHPLDTTNDPLDPDHDDTPVSDRPSGWAGVNDAPGGTGNRPAGPDYGASPDDDETAGSQGEIESGSEGDFGRPPAEGERTDPAV